jgi:hypothetical protein
LLLTIVYKILATAIKDRLTQSVELGEYRNGFRNNRATTDNIGVMCQRFDKCYKYKVKMYFLYNDFNRAFDTANRLYTD